MNLGQIVHSFFDDYLKLQRGLRPSSIRSYRDTIRLFLCFVARKRKGRITRLIVEDLTYDQVRDFLNHLEEERSNHIRTRNQRLAAIRHFFEFLAFKVPDVLMVSQQIAMIPVKRVSPSETSFLERDDISSLIKKLPDRGCRSLRDKTLILFLYNTGARVQEIADLKKENLNLGPNPSVYLHGKGDKWRTCPLWQETSRLLKLLLNTGAHPEAPVFQASRGRPLTRFGIYKIVRRHGAYLDHDGANPRRVTPHLFRHTAAIHLLESGVEINVIRAWLGHVSLETTNRYAEITTKMKQEALQKCEPPLMNGEGHRQKPVWKDDATLLEWLNSL